MSYTTYSAQRTKLSIMVYGNKDSLLVTFGPRLTMCPHGPSFIRYARYMVSHWPGANQIQACLNDGHVLLGGRPLCWRFHSLGCWLHRMIPYSTTHSIVINWVPSLVHRYSLLLHPTEAVVSLSVIAVHNHMQPATPALLVRNPNNRSGLIWCLQVFPSVFRLFPITNLPLGHEIQPVIT